MVLCKDPETRAGDFTFKKNTNFKKNKMSPSRWPQQILGSSKDILVIFALCLSFFRCDRFTGLCKGAGDLFSACASQLGPEFVSFCLDPFGVSYTSR